MTFEKLDHQYKNGYCEDCGVKESDRAIHTREDGSVFTVIKHRLADSSWGQPDPWWKRLWHRPSSRPHGKMTSLMMSMLAKHGTILIVPDAARKQVYLKAFPLLSADRVFSLEELDKLRKKEDITNAIIEEDIV